MMVNKAAVVCVVGIAAAAHADIVKMGFTGTGQGQKVRISAGSRSFGTFAGQLLFNVTEATGVGEELLGKNAFYCTDLFQSAASASTEYLITGLTEVPDSAPMSEARADAIRDIFAFANEEQFAADVSDDFATAFQLSVWEIVSDYDSAAGRSSLDVDSGWFQASGWSTSSLGTNILGYMDELFDSVGSDTAYGGRVLAFQSATAQDQLRSVSGRTIPTPGSTASVLVGLLIVSGGRRRKS